MYLADTLSRAYLTETDDTVNDQSDMGAVNMMESLNLENGTLKGIATLIQGDPDMQDLQRIILKGWPQVKQEVPKQLHNYFDLRDELVTHDGLIYRGERLLIPPAARKNMMEQIHAAHQGIQASIRRARESVYWPGITTQLKDYIGRCEICTQNSDQQQKETLQSHEVPRRPWSKVAMDIFFLDDRNYLITVDYFSNYWEIDYLKDLQSETVIGKVKSQFARHGIPECVISDNEHNSPVSFSANSPRNGIFNIKPHRQDMPRAMARLKMQLEQLKGY
ncbi:uncharacterized protein K02A2.6-like [Anneissia japonica]|uniref:uncharacterized protein K02A2.6-like n=1 Tax=Anneissia japonica TaxID=1529436 RepID=UPI0014259C9A|nr:uncharacterized protein K02A2.6-like [Anneissia japonica]